MKRGLFFLLFMVAFVFKGFSQSTPADSTEMYAYIDSVLAETRGPIKRTDFFNLLTTFNSYMAVQGVNGTAIINAGDTASMLTPYISRSDTAAMLASYTRYVEFLDSISDLRALGASALQLTDTAAMLQSYIQRSDTASMLTPYINRSDTSFAFAPFIERSDTATMLTPYIIRNDTASMLASYIQRSDTASMLTPYISRNDTASMLNTYTRRTELEDTAIAIRNDLNAVIGSKTDTTEFNALELTYNPNSQPILNKHYRAVDKQTIYIEEINNAAQGVSRLLNTTLSSGRNAYQDAEVVWMADNSDSAVTYSNKGADFNLVRADSTYGINNQGIGIWWQRDYPAIDFSKNQQKAGLKLYPYSDSYYLILQKAQSLGYTLPSDSVKNAQNELIVDLQVAGIWNNLDVFYVFKTDGDSDFATINWIDPDNFQITKENSPTFTTKDGFAGDGVSAALNTNYNLRNNGVNYTLNSASAGYFTNTNVAELRTMGSSGSRLFFTPNFNNSVGYFRINATSPSPITVSSLTHLGLVVANRSASNEENLYVDGVSIYSGTTASTEVDPNNLYGLRAGNGYAGSNFTLQLMFAGGSMKDKIVDFSNIVNNYMDKL